MPIRKKLLAAVATAATVTAGLVGFAGPASAASTGISWPAHYSAPYVDISAYPTFNLTQAAEA